MARKVFCLVWFVKTIWSKAFFNGGLVTTNFKYAEINKNQEVNHLTFLKFIKLIFHIMLKLRLPKSKKAECGVVNRLRILILSSTYWTSPLLILAYWKTHSWLPWGQCFGFNSLCQHCHALPKEARKCGNS